MRATTRRCGASSTRSRTIAPDATGTPITIQESARTVTRRLRRRRHHRHRRHRRAAARRAAPRPAMSRSSWRRSLLAGLLTLATGVLVGLPLNFANIITLPLLLGIGVAFDIYFVMRWRAGLGDLLQSSTARADPFQRAHHRHGVRQPRALQSPGHGGDGQAADDRARLHAALHLLRAAGAARAAAALARVMRRRQAWPPGTKLPHQQRRHEDGDVAGAASNT